MDNLTPDTNSPLNPETFVRNWQQTGMRILRAQERMLQGVTAAAKLEMRYSQELVESRLSVLKWTETDTASRSDRAKEEVDRLVALMRDVTEELRNGFTEATRLLADATEEAVEQAEEVAHVSTQETTELFHRNVQTGMEAVRQTTARTQRNLAKTAELSQEAAAKAEGIVSKE